MRFAFPSGSSSLVLAVFGSLRMGIPRLTHHSLPHLERGMTRGGTVTSVDKDDGRRDARVGTAIVNGALRIR